MRHIMLVNAVHSEQKRMAIVEDGKLVEFNIQMSLREPITGNIYKGIVLKIERGLQAAFVNFGVGKDGFLPLRDVGPEYFTEKKDNGREGGHPKGSLKPGQEVIVQVAREVSGRKGALLTTYLSLPGRYLVLLPNKPSSGISRKIEDEEDRKLLKTLVEQIKIDEGMGFIVRTAGINRTKQELSRDYQHLSRLWKEIRKRAETDPAPALIYQESDFGVRSLRDYFTSEIEEILVDDIDTYREMRAYCKAVMPRNLRLIKQYKERFPVFGRYNLEEQIREIYQARVELKSGGSIVISPTEAMITIDVNSGRGSNKKNVEDTAFKTNLEAAEEIGRQLRLRDLGGLIAIDFIDMTDRKHEAEVEKTFKKALALDRSRIQMSRISKFGILELSRQKKHSTIQEISYTTCPFCSGSGARPSLEYTALSAFRKIETEAAREKFSALKVTVPYEIADYLLNQKRSDIQRIETRYDLSIHLSGKGDMVWDSVAISTAAREIPPEAPEAAEEERSAAPVEAACSHEAEPAAPEVIGEPQESPLEAAPEEAARKKRRRRPRGRRKKPQGEAEAAEASSPDGTEAPSPSEESVSGGDLFHPPVMKEERSEETPASSPSPQGPEEPSDPSGNGEVA